MACTDMQTGPVSAAKGHMLFTVPQHHLRAALTAVIITALRRTAGTSYGVRSISYGASGYNSYGAYLSGYVSSGNYGYGAYAYGSNYGVMASGGTYDFYASGSGTNYGPFTGGHEVKLAPSFPQDVKAGMIVSATGEVQKREDGASNVSVSSTLPTVRLAAAVNDKSVFGAFVSETDLPDEHWYVPGADKRFASINALGEGRVWVSSINGEIQTGDYITTSVVPGYGQKQDDDLLHGYTLDKAIETVDWESVTETIEHNGRTYKIYLIAVVYTSG
jgi:hypothetical protein